MTLVAPAWDRVVAEQPDLAADIDPAVRAALLDEARALLSGYYRLEDPTRFDPQSCEQRVEVELADGTLLRGFVDRIDVAPTGELRVVDYKTGKAPPEARALAEFKAMFQMKFYAVALLRSRGVLPARLRLLYLADGQVLDYSPDLDELLRFEKTLIGDLAGHPIRRAPQAISAPTRRGCATGAPTTRTARCSAARRRRIRAGPSAPTKATPTRCCTQPRSPLRDRLPLPSAAPAIGGGYQVFESTDDTRSNWDSRDPARFAAAGADDQAHRGTRGTAPALRIGRLSLDILGAIPVAPVRVRAWVERPGTRISMMAAEMLAARPGGPDRAVARVTAWLLATSDTSDVATDRYPPLVEGEATRSRTAGRARPGYLEAVSWRRQRDARRRCTGGVAQPAGPPGRRRGDDATCSGWRWWSTAPTARAPRWILSSSCS